MRIRETWRTAQRTAPFGANTALTAITNLTLALLGLVSGVMAARLLAPRGRGELAAIQTWANVIAILAPLGLTEALVYYSASDRDRAGRYLSSAIVLSMASCIPFMLIAYAAMPFLLHAQSSIVISEARVYLLMIPIYLLNGMPFHPLRGRGDFAVWNAIRLAYSLLWIATLVAMWVMSRREASSVAYTYLAASAFAVIPLYVLACRRIPGPFIPEPRNWPRMLHYGLPCVFTTAPQLLNLRLDQMLIAAFLPARSLGLYVVAVAWSGALGPLLNSVAGVLMPAVASQDSAGSRAQAFAKGSRLAVLLALGSAVATLIVTPWAIVILFGSGFREAIGPAMVLVPAGAIAGLNTVASEGIRGLGRPVEAMKAELFGLAVTVGLLLLLLPSMGIMGAALASLFSYATILLSLFIFAQRLTGESTSALLVPNGREVYESLRRLQLLVRGASA